MQVQCDICGALIDKRGLASHRRSMQCDVNAARRGLIARGMRPIDWHHRAVLERLGVSVERAPDGVVPGFSGRRAKFRYCYYAPAWAARVVSTLGYISPVAEAAIRRAIQDEAFREALTAAAKVGAGGHMLVAFIEGQLTGQLDRGEEEASDGR